MRHALPALLLVVAAPALAEERRFPVTDFDRVQVDGPFEVTLATGSSNSAVASGSSAEIDQVAIGVQGRTLRIRPNVSAWGGYPGQKVRPARIALATHDLRSVSVQGSGNLRIDAVRAMRFDLALSGSGSIDLGRVEADQLVLGLTGSGAITVGGTAKTLKAMIEGSGDLHAKALAVDDADIKAGTTGAIDVAVRRAVTVTATGSGSVAIAGSPACTVRQLGAGPVFCGTDSDQR